MQPAGRVEEVEEEEGLSEQALAALAAEYSDGGQNDPFNDPAWWEAAVAELQGFESMMGAGRGDQAGDQLDDAEQDQGGEEGSVPGKDGLTAIEEAQGWVTLSTDQKKKQQARSLGMRAAGSQQVLSGSVEEALRRPRLDAALGAWMGEDEEAGAERDWQPAAPGTSSRRVPRVGRRVRAQTSELAEKDKEEGEEGEQEAMSQQSLRRRRWAANGSKRNLAVRRGLGLKGSR